MKHCKHCGKELTGSPMKEFCNDSHKVMWHRRQKEVAAGEGVTISKSTMTCIGAALGIACEHLELQASEHKVDGNSTLKERAWGRQLAADLSAITNVRTLLEGELK